MNTLFYNGKIYTMDKENTVVEAIGICDGKIDYLGENENFTRKYDKMINLDGRTVLPGFVDSHIHTASFAWYSNNIKLNSFNSMEEIVKAASKFLDNHSFDDGKWFIGRGWDQHKFENPVMPCKDDLDKISLDIPVAFLRVCGHVSVVNSKALEIILGIVSDEEVLANIDVDSGLMKENAARLFMSAMPSFTSEDIVDMFIYSQNQLHSQGVTSIHTDDFTTLPVEDKDTYLKAFEIMRKKGLLKTRLYNLLSFNDMQQLEGYFKSGLKSGSGDEWVKIGPVKIICDGSLGGKTAALSEDYSDMKGYKGILNYDELQLTKLINVCRENELDVTIHAIGDRAMELAANCVTNSNKQFGNTMRRHGILHAQIGNVRVFEKMAQENIQAFMQPVFMASDMDYAESVVSNPNKLKFYGFRSMLDAGVMVSGSSCAPVEGINVLENIQYAVTREKLEKSKTWLEQERISVKEAVEMFTVKGAYASYEEDIKGSLELGKLGDMVVLSQDIFDIDPSSIKDIRVEKTIVGGEVVYTRD